MINPISPYGSNYSVSTLLNDALNPKKPGEFKPKQTATINIQATLDSIKIDATKQQIFRSAINRLEGIRQGLIEPTAEWETTAGYLQLTGQPFKLYVDERGQLQVLAQAEDGLPDHNTAQKTMVVRAMEEFQQYAEAIDLKNKKDELSGKLAYGVLRLLEMEQHAPAEELWEKSFKLYESMGHPVKLALDAKGELTAVNQLEHDFSDVENADDQLKLITARDKLARILKGESSATEIWEITALGYHIDKEEYFLDLDDNGDVVIKSNALRDPLTGQVSIKNIMPDFLETSEDDIPATTAKWQEDAMAFYEQQRGFYFDFDPSGQKIVVREMSVVNLMGLNKPKSMDSQILAARLSILA